MNRHIGQRLLQAIIAPARNMPPVINGKSPLPDMGEGFCYCVADMLAALELKLLGTAGLWRKTGVC